MIAILVVLMQSEKIAAEKIAILFVLMQSEKIMRWIKRFKCFLRNAIVPYEI